MGARVFGMKRRVVDRQPIRLALGRRIAVDVAIADRGERAPKLVSVLGVHYRDYCILLGRREERQEARGIDNRHPLADGNLALERMGRERARQQPETGVFGLARGTLGAVLLPQLLYLIVVSRPLLAVQCNRRLWPELRWACHREGRDLDILHT